jgi:hypothetical protein
MVQHVVITPRVLQCVRENGHRGELARVVHLTRERHRGVSAPIRRERDRAERIAEDVAEQFAVGGRGEQGNLGAAQFLVRLILGATPPAISEVPVELLPDPNAESYVPPGPTLEELGRRARREALIDLMRGQDVDDQADPPLGGSSA